MAWLKHTLDPSGRTERGSYRMCSAVLLGVVWAIVAVFGDDRRLPLAPAVIALLLYTALILLTIRRLRDAGMSASWVVLMICTINFGPRWRLTPSFYLQVTDLLPLLPVAIGWLLHSADSAGDEVSAT
jgi:uncharacterized membrane protein YhaH (DUF805 family)